MRVRLYKLKRPALAFLICVIIATAMKLYDKSINKDDNTNNNTSYHVVATDMG